MSFVTGNIVKLSDKVIPKESIHSDMYGKLGYLGFFKYFKFKILSTETTSRGVVATCEILNKDELLKYIPNSKSIKVEGNPKLLMEDLVKCNEKITLDYILPKKSDNSLLIKNLFEQRQLLRKSGKAKDHPEMTANWREIRVARGEIKSAIVDEPVKVLLPKQRLLVTVMTSQLPTDKPESIKSFQELLASKLSEIRVQRNKDVKETKDVFGVEVEKVNGVYAKPNILKVAYDKFLETGLETAKKPKEKEANYVGIEIEFIYRDNYKGLKELLVKNRLHKYVKIGRASCRERVLLLV
jgi:hypothetical protein